jgi:large repetitive protein
MKRGLLLITILLLFLPATMAITVTLDAPSNPTTTWSTVTMNCSATDDNTITSIALYTNQSGSLTEVSSQTTADSASFTLSSQAAQSFEWNCLATNDLAATAQADSTSVINIQAPQFTSEIANITIEEDSSSSNAFDLDTYFTSAGTLTYTVSGNTNINVSIDSDNQVTFTPDTDYSGTETILFTASDSYLTNTSNYVTVNITGVNDAPKITTNFSNLTIDQDDSTTLTLSSYFTDPEGDSINYTVSSLGSHLNVSISSATATITPEASWTGTTTVIFNASDGNASRLSSTITITVNSSTTTSTNNAPSIDTYSPTSSPSIEISDSQDFIITYSDDDNDTLTVSWTVDGTSQSETTDTFTYTPTDIGSFTIIATVSDGTDTDSQSWSLTVTGSTFEEIEETSTSESIIGEQTETATCGNGIEESGETCSSCALDVKCETGYICESGACIEKQSATSSIIIFLIILMAVIGIAILIYYYSTAKKVGMKTDNKPFKYKAIKEAPPVDYTDFYKK